MKQGEDVDVGKAVSGGVEEQDMKNLDNLLPLGEADDGKRQEALLNRPPPLFSQQCAETRKEFGPQSRNTNSNTMHSAFVDELSFVATDEESSSDSNSKNETVLRNRNASQCDPTDRAGGAGSLANHLGDLAR